MIKINSESVRYCIATTFGSATSSHSLWSFHSHIEPCYMVYMDDFGIFPQTIKNHLLRFIDHKLRTNIFEEQLRNPFKIEKFNGNFPKGFNADSSPFQPYWSKFPVIQFVAAGIGCEPINPNLISSWGYSIC